MYPSMTTYLPSNSGNFGGLSLQICRAPIIHSPPDRRSSSTSLTSVQGRQSTDSTKTRDSFLPEIHGNTLQGSPNRPPSKTAVIVRAKSGKLTSKPPNMAFQHSPSVPKFQGSSVSVLVDSAAVKKALESLNLQEHDSGISSEDSNNEHHDSTETTTPTATVTAADKGNKNKKKTKRKVKSGSKMGNRKIGNKPGLKLKTRAKSAKSIYSQTLVRGGSAVGFNTNSLRLQTRQKTVKSDQRVSRTSEATRRDYNKMSAPKTSSEIIYSQKFSRLHPNSSIHAVSKSLDSAQPDKRQAGFLSARRAEVPMFSPRRADLLPSPRRPSTNGAEGEKMTRIFLSEKQSGMMKDCGVFLPCAPPATPSKEQMERYEFVPSMTDVRAKREVQARLQLMDKAAKQKKAKQMEIAKRQEKRKEKDGVAGHKARQRLEIYALNKIMSEYEWSNFQAFKRSINGGV
ncbi:uncharacterized protein LOC118430340 [Branchiostoma floridae]|uniref:Small vasohibin-binding protein n=1 Tax=Branchiostoma floridae TaxID=7739 RepID=C3XYK7_BRAFL|nr:uncharacterized protein LOC118430340 [Branchiostoma floridae]|eukprot:XP_002610882.1 hypothetical protein BRAFLDRAFT_126269 [Branchiostoma floridae]